MKHPALRYHGGKFRLAPWVIGHFPAHEVYVEPFGGAASVLLQKPRAYAEVYNDLDGDVVNFFRVLRDPALSARLVELCRLTPYSREEFELAFMPTADPLEAARRLAVRASMGFGSAGATKGSTGLRIDTRRKYGTAASIWAGYPETIAAATTRLRGVFIENRPAMGIIEQHDDADALIYCDPPYVLSTRDPRVKGSLGDNGSGASSYYRHEMHDVDHEALLDRLLRARGMVAISGYDNELYTRMLAGWERHETTSRISAGRGAGLRLEVLWINPACAEALRCPRTQGELVPMG